MDTDSSCGNTPTDWLKLNKMESVEQSMEQEETRICVTTHRKCSVMPCGCVREVVGVSGAGEYGRPVQACSAFTQSEPGNRGLTWRPGRGFSLNHVQD